MKGLIRKGDTISRPNGASYTVTSLLIGKQLVRYDYRSAPDAPALQQEVSAAGWRLMVASLLAPSDTEVPAAGTRFRMMDSSEWAITVATDEYLTIGNGAAEQTLPVKEYNQLLQARYIAILGE
jgi:hypothetical protein